MRVGRGRCITAGLAAVLMWGLTAGTARAQLDTVALDLEPDEVGSGPRIVYLYPDYPFTLDPQNGSSFANALGLQFFDTLLTYRIDFEKGVANQTDLVPRLAESWDISPDANTLTFHLRQDAKFWDGTPVTAEDVHYSIERALEGRMGWGTTQIESGGILSVDQLKIVDPYTLQITYPEGMNRYSLRNFAAISYAIISKKACMEGAGPDDPWCVEWIKRNAMGSGPYKIGDYQSGEFMIAVANKDYWRDVKPYFSEIMFRVVPDSQTRMLLLQSGDADIAYLSPPEYETVANDPNVTIFSLPRQQDVAVMRWKPTTPPFDDPKIREAVTKAIPYDRIVEDICRGLCSRVKNLVGLDTLGYYEEELFTTDLEAAKALVAESKYAGNVPSFEVPLAESSPHMNAAVVIQDSLRQIGLDMRIRPLTGTAFDEIAWKRRALDVSIHSMGPWWNDFMYWAYWMYSTDSRTNHIQYSNAELDEAVVDALLIPQEQEEPYLALQKPVLSQLIDGRLAAPLYQVHWTVAHSSKICNMALFPWAQIGLEYLRECDG